jgi:transcriptional regulator with XRE-family HTH domain
MYNNNDQIGDRIKKVRKALSLTQKEFADKLGISRTTISSYEKKQHTPPEALIRLMASVYNININYLISNEEPMFIDMNHLIPQDKMQTFENFCKDYGFNTNTVSQKILQEVLTLIMSMPDNKKYIVYELLKLINEINNAD